MRRQSNKRRKIIASVSQAREAFVFEVWQCMICRSAWRQKFPATLDVHEIARGGSRERAYQDRRAWLLLCREHHEDMDDADEWPVARQYALKKLCDPDHYDRVWLNRCRDRADDAITEKEVDAFMEGPLRLGG